jgi:hypothetical protein
MMTLTGAAVSDGLEDGTVISGVGGQYNFVDMAHALPDGHSIIQLRSTRNCNGVVKSNIVWNYGHITIPRHLRDIVISEYGMVNIRGKTDEEIIKSLIQIADSRFQKQLIEQAVKSGKLSSSYQIPEDYRNNYPHVLEKKLAHFKKNDYFTPFPFGTDFTHEEQVLGKALKSLKRKTATPLSKVSTILKALFVTKASDKLKPYLKRMQLESPKTVEERLYHKLLVKELSNVV